jgi:hypothetical protein
MVKTVRVNAVAGDIEFGASSEGEWFDDTGMTIFREDVDVIGVEPDGTEHVLLKFRKNVITKELVQEAWDAFRGAAGPSRNRGAAAGPIDVGGKYWGKRKPTGIDRWSTRYMQGDKVSKMRVNNNVASGVVGYYEKTPFLGIPCRMTAYARSNMKNFLHGHRFLHRIDALFKQLIPDAHKKQLAIVKKTPAYRIGTTAFSTVTVNNNFRTALHKDAGDYRGGFGNLSVIEWGKYHGGHTLMPRFKIGVDVRTGDFLAMNVHEWHTNSPIYETAEDKAYNKTLPDIRTRDPEVGVAGSDYRFSRLTFVCYYREKLQQCDVGKTKEYYERVGFDEDAVRAAAKHQTVVPLPLPGITGSMANAHRAFDETRAGSAARVLRHRREARGNLTKRGSTKKGAKNKNKTQKRKKVAKTGKAPKAIKAEADP